MTMLASLATALQLIGANPASADSASFTPTADTWVNSNQPSQNNGAAMRILANGSPIKYGLIQFDVEGIPDGATDIQATLTLTSPTSQTPEEVEIHALDNGWDEAATYATAPRPGATLASGTMPSSGSLSLPVPVSGNGTVSFALTKAAGGDSIAASRENAAKAPRLAVSWSAGTVSTPPTADYRYDPVSGGAPLTVSFDNVSTGATDYLWDFGDGTTSTEAEPGEHTFTDPGMYAVTLTATSSAGSDSITGTVSVSDPTPPPPPGDGPFIPYGSTSLLQTPLPANAPVSADNAFFRSWEQGAEPVDYWKLRVTSKGFAQNYAEGQCSDPVFTIVSTGKTPSGQGFLKTTGFHADEAVLAAMVQNSDSPIMVRDFCGTVDRPGGMSVWAANVLYDGTHTLKSGGDGTITAGSFDWRTNGLDSRAPSSDAAAGVNSVSRGRIPDSMVITDDELRAGMDGAHNGTAGHSVEVFFVETNSSAGFQEPMTGAEGGNVGCGGAAHPGLCAEGQYVRIDPSLPVPAGCTGAAAVVFRTLQTYGGYIGDNSGSGSGIKMQAGTTLVNNNSLQPCMHLNQLQILEKGYTPPHS
jgi:PKD repeat protein